MKRIIFLGFMLSLFTNTFAQSSATCDALTVYTDNGAYVKAKNASESKSYTVEISFKETSIKDGERVSTEDSYHFSIGPGEEKQLFVSQNIISDIRIPSCKATVNKAAVMMNKMQAKENSGQ